ncbi:MAG: membrane protein insertase YidC [Bacteroidetes bacterium]|nr:MAG: membrane protein insertase YidC [Bacteroidota bacterium]
MNRDNIIGLILIFVILIGFSILNTPSEEERELAQRQRDSIAALREEQQRLREAEAARIPDTVDIESTEEVAIIENDTIREAALRDRLGYFAGAARGEEEFFTIENEVLKLIFNSKGGFLESIELKEFNTWDQRPLKLIYGDDNVFNLQFYSVNRLISTNELYFTANAGDIDLTTRDQLIVNPGSELTFSMRLYPDNHTPEMPRYLEFAYVIRGDGYKIDFNINTVGLTDVIAANSTFLNLDWQMDLHRMEKSRRNELNVTTIYYKYFNDDVERLRETRDVTESLRTPVRWISFKQQFFSSILIAGNNFSSAVISTRSYDEVQDTLLRRMSATIEIPYNSRENNFIPMHFYFGPNHFNTLKAYDLKLEEQIPLGWALFGWINRFIVIPVFNYLDARNLSYGIIILILTVMLKLVLFPIAFKTYVSQARMRVLKPDIEELNKKFPKKEDAMKKQQATMALYKKAGVNPMAGCVPMLLQFPFLIAMFRFFPASFELRQEGFLWADDLSSYDSILDLPFTIPWYGDHVSLFTLLMAGSTIIYTRMNSQMMNTGAQQMPGMKTMLYIMPVMLLFIFNSFASGLSYYYFLANVITFGQMYAFRFMIDEEKIHKRIEENKKKPVKKSSFQKRLEEMTKKQQQMQQQQRKKKK